MNTNKIENNVVPMPNSERRTSPVKNCVEISMKLYFQRLNGEQTADLYQLVMGQAESALLKSVMQYTKGNQSKAAECLGINRGTLRKKLKEHKLGS